MFDHNNLLFVVSVDVAKEQVFAEDFWGTLQTTIQYVPAKVRWEIRSVNPENGISYAHETAAGAEPYSVWRNTRRNPRESLVRGAKRAISALLEAARERTGLYRLVDCGGHKYFAGHNNYGGFEAIISLTDMLHLAEQQFYFCNKNDIRGHDRGFFRRDVLCKYGSKPIAVLMPRGVRFGRKDRGVLWFDVSVDGIILRVRYDLDIRALQCSVRGNNDKWVTVVNIEYGALVATPDTVVENCCDYLGLSLAELANIYEDESFLCSVI